MGKLAPVKRDQLIARLVRLGFNGPHAGGKHAFMIRGAQRLPLPNLHKSDIGSGLLARILRTAGIAREEWEGTR